MNYITGKWRQKLHLESPMGWINDPNGLSFFKGKYHVYFQYAPENADGSGLKCWGHYESTDLISWDFTGTVLYPDIAEDKDGVYSGSAVVNGDRLEIFYTGNVKEEGDHDYIKSGRGANVIHVSTVDGHEMSGKKILLRNSDYPDFCSCHVRDPKVWKENDIWYMVLGARTVEDKGCVLLYSSSDLEKWEYVRCAEVEGFGYMWECPDLFTVENQPYLSVSPQGLTHEKTRFMNVYQSGYFRADDLNRLENFTEWDCGFDFYAPQSFETADGRRIIIAWMGIGDIPYENPTVALGYQHCLTLPREVTKCEDGVLFQRPIREINALHNEKFTVENGGVKKVALPFDLYGETDGKFEITLDKGLKMLYDGAMFTLEFTDSKIGGGREKRYAEIANCHSVRVIADMSSVEIYLDGGRKVLSTRFYPEGEQVEIKVSGFSAEGYTMNGMKVDYLGK